MKIKIHQRIPRGLVTLTLLISMVSLTFAAWPCDQDPTDCTGADHLRGKQCDSNGNKWTVDGPNPLVWWGCQGTGACPNVGVAAGSCTQAVRKQFNTYIIGCGASLRTCVAGSGTMLASPNRTCDDRQCGPGDTIPWPAVIKDVCANGGTWPPNHVEQVVDYWLCTAL